MKKECGAAHLIQTHNLPCIRDGIEIKKIQSESSWDGDWIRARAKIVCILYGSKRTDGQSMPFYTCTYTHNPAAHKRAIWGAPFPYTLSILLSSYRWYCMKNSNKSIKTKSSNAHILPSFLYGKKCKICEHTKPGKL